jgi:hypothetical protein
MEWIILIFVLLAARSGSASAAPSPVQQSRSILPVQQGRVLFTSVETHIPSGTLIQPDAPAMTSLKVDSHLNSIHQLAYTDSLFTSATEGLGPDDFEKERATLGFQ